MLRTRKKDVRIKPNRKLDKRSSRSMLFENEELRLRTMEINAEVERGQSSIKKLRRENDHLRREMWALRDEYERLEALIKNLDLASPGAVSEERPQFDAANYADQVRGPDANHQGNDANVETDGNSAHLAANVYVEAIDLCNADMDNIENYQKAYGRMPRRCSSAGIRTTWPRSANKADSLNINEEDEDGYTACSLLHSDITKQIVTRDALPGEKGSMSGSHENLALRQIGSSTPALLPAGQVPTCSERQTTDYLVTGACETVTEEACSPAQRSLEVQSDQRCGKKDKVKLKLPTVVVSLPQEDNEQLAKELIDTSISSVQIHQDNSQHYEKDDDIDSASVPITKTITFDLAEHAVLRNISVQTIIDELEKQMDSELSTIRGVRIVGTLVYISLDEHASILRCTGQELSILGNKVHLVNLSEDSVFVIMSGVPHNVSDNTILTLVSAYGTTTGEVERRLYKGIDTGERLVRVHLKGDVQIPRYFTVEGCRILVRVLGFDYSLPWDGNGFEADNRSTSDFATDSKPKIAKSFKYRSQLSIDLQALPAEADDKSHHHITPMHTTDPLDCNATRPRLPSVNFGLGAQLPDAGPPKPQDISRRKKSSTGILRRSFFGPSVDEEEPVLPKTEQRHVTSTGLRRCQVSQISQRESRFSFFSRRQRRKGVVQMSSSCDNLSEETLDDSFTSRGIRRDSERSTESTRSSLRKFENLPWCGCWGNGCL